MRVPEVGSSDATEGGGGAVGGPAGRERRAAALAHFSALLVFFMPFGNAAGPLLVLFVFGGGSPFVRGHALFSAALQGGVAVLAWAFFAASLLHGWDVRLHFGLLLLSLLPAFILGVTALAGVRPPGPWGLWGRLFS